ncbi:MAG: hypothetical protein QW615_01550 [Desulfurococcaceae archaeon]
MNSEEKDSQTRGSEGRQETSKKIDVSKLISIIPPPSELWKEEKKIVEKRIRVKYDESLPEKTVKISSELAKILDISKDDYAEIIVAGRKKFIYRVIVDDGLDLNTIYSNPIELRENGVADNSIATIRKHRRT